MTEDIQLSRRLAKNDEFRMDLCVMVEKHGYIMVWNSASSVSLYEAPRLHQHEYVENSSLPYRDLDQKEFIQKNYSCKCGAGKYERVPV